MRRDQRMLAFSGVAVAVVLTAAACGGSSSGGNATVSTQSGGSAAVVTTHASPAGTYLTDAKGRTLYLWAADTSSTSTCAGPCTKTWEPFETSGAPKASGGAQQSMLGTTKRSDGGTQVTYNNHPLYYYDDDKNPGQMEGQGSTEFGALWTIVSPNGAAITPAKAPSPTSSSSSSGETGWG